jgi:transposase
MRARIKKSYDQSFKDEAVSLLERSDKTPTQVAASLGVPTATLMYWYKQDVARRRARNKQPASNAVPGETLEQKLARLEQENAALRKENEDLRVDRDILKKAAAFFVRESK